MWTMPLLLHLSFRFAFCGLAIVYMAGCAYTGRQEADISALRDAPAPADITSILPRFPTAKREARLPTSDSESWRIAAESGQFIQGQIEIMVAEGIHLPTGERSKDGAVETLILNWPDEPGEYLSGGVNASVALYASLEKANDAFEFASCHLRAGIAMKSGTAADRCALSKVMQERSDTWQLLNKYSSEAVFQKGRLVVEVNEYTSDRLARMKTHVIGLIARAIKGETIIPKSWGGANKP